MLMYEGAFRRPRIKTNLILKRYAHLFSGAVINVSGSNDSDKHSSMRDYYFGDFDSGERYKDYFSSASSYLVSNYPGDETENNLPPNEQVMIDLEEELSEELVGQFDVVFNHTVLEHVFDVFRAFENLCLLSKDIVILVVPQAQKIHDYGRGYADYWRLTPFSVERLFERHGFTVLHREATSGFSESIYLFYIATKNPDKWHAQFDPPPPSVVRFLSPSNDGSKMTLFSFWWVKADHLLRRFFSIFRRKFKIT